MLMVDPSMHWNVENTLRLAERLIPYDLSWIEEPLPTDDMEGYTQLVSRCPIAISGGEHEFTIRGFRELIERKAHDILQPDATWCGGMTQLIEVYRAARNAGIRVIPHRGAEVWSLHAISAFDEESLAESPREWMSWVLNQPAVQRGTVQINDLPGFGVEFDPSIWI